MFIVWNDVFNGVYMEFCRHFFAKIFVKFIAGSTTHTHTYTRRRQKPLDKRRTVEVPKIFVYYGDALPHLCLPQYNKKNSLMRFIESNSNQYRTSSLPSNENGGKFSFYFRFPLVGSLFCYWHSCQGYIPLYRIQFHLELRWDCPFQMA